ncbi:MAG: hypothetical protein RMZ69_03370 [Nostoc sp. ChiQUE01a]|nr:hypothetical protein [Nostoc sp. DedQUE11]MDZ8071830.1 hypothetical protein [Nostoc sp. DedQUE01]MDZ8236208.1 hypothetical protein [Nostoc sp. ChiQUE01a]
MKDWASTRGWEDKGTRNAIATLLGQGEQLHIVPQNLIEFWNL